MTGARIKNLAEFAFCSDTRFAINLGGTVYEYHRDVVERFQYRNLKAIIDSGKLYKVKGGKNGKTDKI